MCWVTTAQRTSGPSTVKLPGVSDAVAVILLITARQEAVNSRHRKASVTAPTGQFLVVGLSCRRGTGKGPESRRGLRGRGRVGNRGPDHC